MAIAEVGAVGGAARASSLIRRCRGAVRRGTANAVHSQRGCLDEGQPVGRPGYKVRISGVWIAVKQQGKRPGTGT